MNNWGKVGMWWLKAENAGVVPDLLRRINAEFASTSAEVRAETERAFQMSFVSMWGNISLLINSICTVVVFTLGAGNGQHHEHGNPRALPRACRLEGPRLSSPATCRLHSCGEPGARPCRSADRCGRRGRFSSAPESSVFFPFSNSRRESPRLAFLIGGLLGVIAMLAPARSVSRMSVVEGLKTLD